ncbi:MAG: hypothetical protein ACOVQH_03650 [Burkholderiaceae bacterium]
MSRTTIFLQGYGLTLATLYRSVVMGLRKSIAMDARIRQRGATNLA